MVPLGLAVLWPMVLLALALSWRQVAHTRLVKRRVSLIRHEVMPVADFGETRRPGLRERWSAGPAAAALRLRISEYILFRTISFLGPFVVGYVIRGVVGGLLLGAVGLAVLTGYFRTKQNRWLKDAEAALPEFLRGVASTLRAGSSLSQAMALVAVDTAGALGDEVRRVLKREALGFSINETLNELTQRIPSRDLALAVMAITIQREVGGSLADVLDNIVQTIVDRQRLKSEVRVLTAQGRYSGWLLTVLPFVLGLLLYFTDPSYMGALISSRLGWGLLGGAVLLVLIGGFVINRMVKAPEM